VTDVDLGLCCGCDEEPATSIVFLDKKAPIPGRGWACFACGLRAEGALAVLCQSCFVGHMSGETVIEWVCAGYPALDGRVAFDSLTGVHRHDLEKHAEFPPGHTIVGEH